MLRLNREQQQHLLAIARGAVRSELSHLSRPDPAARDPVLEAPSGAFVSIYKDDRLRGCIGRVGSDRPVRETVVECAVSAAVSDPRFPPMELAELDGASFEISVLSEMKSVASVDEIRVPGHGLLVETQESRGLLLPQVASENGWGPSEFLAETCLKAGLDPNAWKSAARLFVFEAQVFGERA